MSDVFLPFVGLGILQNSFLMADCLRTFVKIRGKFQGLIWDIENAEVKIACGVIVGSILKYLIVSASKEMHGG